MYSGSRWCCVGSVERWQFGSREAAGGWCRYSSVVVGEWLVFRRFHWIFGVGLQFVKEWGHLCCILSWLWRFLYLVVLPVWDLGIEIRCSLDFWSFRVLISYPSSKILNVVKPEVRGLRLCTGEVTWVLLLEVKRSLIILVIGRELWERWRALTRLGLQMVESVSPHYVPTSMV